MECFRSSLWRQLYFPVPQWIPVGLGRVRGMCPGRQGHGQHLLRPPLHRLLHGFLCSVSLGVTASLWIFAYLSLTMSLFFISRQCYSSFKKGNMDSALSIWFLLLWLAGDSCNLIGSFLADQLPLQVMGVLVLYASVPCFFFDVWLPTLCIFRFHMLQSFNVHVGASEMISHGVSLCHLDIHGRILRSCWLGDAEFVFLLQDKEQSGWKWVFLVSCSLFFLVSHPPSLNSDPYSL